MLSAVAAESIFTILDIQQSQASDENLPILLYHRIGPEADALTVSPSRFQDDLQYLSANGYKTLTLAEAKDYLAGGKVVTGKFVLITFDDGYLDNYINAFPLLQSFAMAAGFFVITGMLDQPNRMTVSQVMEMSAAGMSFGSHTVNHRSLGTLSLQETGQELKKSKTDLEDIIGKSVDFVAYPRGSYTQATLESTQDSGYHFGLTTNNGYANLQINRLTLNRIPVFRYDQGLGAILNRNDA